MDPKDSDIRHVSDTALMVAACRALETATKCHLERVPAHLNDDSARRAVYERVGMDSFKQFQDVRAEDHPDGAGILDAVLAGGWTHRTAAPAQNHGRSERREPVRPD